MKEELESKLKEHVKENAEGIIQVPPFISFLCVLSVVMLKISTIAVSIVLAGAVFIVSNLTASNYTDYLGVNEIPVFFIFIYLGLSILMTLQGSAAMRDAGILGEYISLIVQQRKIPKLLVRLFAKSSI